VILEDITQARLMDEVKTNLISTVSHELKTPITSLRMALRLLLEKDAEPLTPTQEKLLKTSREETERLLRTLGDLLDLTRLEQGPPELHLQKTSAKSLLESSLQTAQEFTPDATSRIKLHVWENTPDVHVDRQRIAYVFNNLLINALKYSEPHTPIEIEVYKNAEGDTEFHIRDQGPGIPEAHLPRIFDKFYRVPGTKKPGSGLGLSIAREIVLAHQGQIQATSVAGKGTEFVVTIPSAL